MGRVGKGAEKRGREMERLAVTAGGEANILK